MAVTVTAEDGSGVAGANSYVTVAAFKVYADNQGWVYSSYTDDQIGTAVIRGSRAVDALYSGRFPGVRSGSTQSMGWPRRSGSYINGVFIESWPTQVSDSEGVLIATNAMPQAIVDAACELAWIELQKPGSVTPTIPAGGGYRRVRAGSVEVERFSPSEYSKRASFDAVDGILATLLGMRRGAAEVDLLRN